MINDQCGVKRRGKIEYKRIREKKIRKKREDNKEWDKLEERDKNYVFIVKVFFIFVFNIYN